MYRETYPSLRFEKTIAFFEKHISKQSKILDLGVKNPLSELLIQRGYTIENTHGEDLDKDQSSLQNKSYDVVSAFEILEHLLNPYTVLKNIKADTIVISVPLRLWFSPAYRSKTDLRDRHFHEFEPWQLDWLIEETGFEILDKQQWAHGVNKFGIRPFLRRFTPRYYIVLAQRKKI